MVPMAGVEPARLLGTAPSRQRVYQFHHIGTYCWKKRGQIYFSGKPGAARDDGVKINLSPFLFIIRVWMGDPFRARPRGYWRDRTVALQLVAQVPSVQLY